LALSVNFLHSSSVSSVHVALLVISNVDDNTQALSVKAVFMSFIELVLISTIPYFPSSLTVEEKNTISRIAYLIHFSTICGGFE